MQPRQHLPADALQLIEHQAGVIHVAQLAALGISSRVLERMSSDWERVSRGIYLTTPPIWESALWAGLLRAGKGGAIGGLAACFLEKGLRDRPSTVLVWSRNAKQGFAVGEWQIEFRRGAPSAYRNPPRTRIHDSLLDVAATSSEFDAVAAITSAFSRNVAYPDRLLAALAGRAHQRHRESIEALCAPDAKGVHSLIEWVFLRDVIRAHGLPPPDLQVPKSAGRVDQHYQHFATIIELDGQRDHAEWSRDMYRDNQHLLDHGTFTLRYGLVDSYRRPCDVASQVAQRLRSQGWRGQTRPCRRCRAA